MSNHYAAHFKLTKFKWQLYLNKNFKFKNNLWNNILLLSNVSEDFIASIQFDET